MDLVTFRQNLDQMNTNITLMVEKRIDIIRQIALYKQTNGLPIINKNREKEVILSFEKEFIKHGMKPETGRIIARALICAAIEEERLIIKN